MKAGTRERNENRTRVTPKKLIKKFEDLPSDWKAQMMERAQEGVSFPRMHASIGLNRYSHEKFLAEHEEYREWFALCQDIALDEWVLIGKDIIFDRNANAQVYSFIMKNMFKWIQQDPLPKKEEEKPTETFAPEAELGKFKKQGKQAEIVQQ